MAPQPLHPLRLSPLAGHAAFRCSTVPLFGKRLPLVVAFPRAVASCSSVQESPTATTVSEKTEADGGKDEATAEAKPAAKPKKAPAKPLPEMTQEELEGSFIKDEIPVTSGPSFQKETSQKSALSSPS